MRRILAIAAVSGLFLLVWAWGPSAGQDSSKPKPAFSVEEFAGKVLMIYRKPPARGAVLLEVRLKKLGNRTFLVGKTADRDGIKSRWVGLTYWVAVDEVSDIFEFNSLEEAREANAEAARRAPVPPEKEPPK
jgi:hypothetical protein